MLKFLIILYTYPNHLRDYTIVKKEEREKLREGRGNERKRIEKGREKERKEKEREGEQGKCE